MRRPYKMGSCVANRQPRPSLRRFWYPNPCHCGNRHLTKSGPLAYILRMNFEWDDAKSNSCFMRRGFDFAYAVHAFFDPNRIVAQDRRRNYGEDRYRLLGMIAGRAYVVVYTVRGSTIRIISARKANVKEVADYEHNAHQD